MSDAQVASRTSRFYCHQCNVNVTPLEDFICPQCMGGFIEEVEDPVIDDEAPGAEELSGDGGIGLFHDIFRQFAAVPGERRTSNTADGGGQPQATPTAIPVQPGVGPRPRVAQYSIRFPPPAPGPSANPLEAFLQQVITNMVAGGLEPHQGVSNAGGAVGGSGRNFRFQGGTINFELSPFFQVIHGNPGDYAWGHGGLDAVITQLLNNLDASGPPPMSADDIKNLPTVEITEEQVAKALQCSVCMEDFKLKEPVRKLPCSHQYHNDCIIPWLEMHGTCPICRKVFTSESSAAPTSSTDPQPTNRRNNPGSGSNSSSGAYFDLNDLD